MALLIHAVAVSGDTKTGPIPVTYQTEDETCPSSCPLKNGPCYARFHNVGRVWRNLNKGEESNKYLTWDRFLSWVKGLMSGQAWRYGVAGDLPHTGDGETIDTVKLAGLVKANARGKKRGWLYTHHKPEVAGNADAIKAANDGGLTVNMSADNLAEADEFADLGIGPVVTLMPKTENGKCKTPAGRPVIECLVSSGKVRNCVECRFLCAKADRKFIIGFTPHGAAAKSATKIMNAA